MSNKTNGWLGLNIIFLIINNALRVFEWSRRGRRGKKFTENYKEKHTIDAMYGWYRYESRFALPVFNEVGEIERYNVFNVIMVIRHAKDGKMYLYDIMNIKKETSTLFQSEDITQ